MRIQVRVKYKFGTSTGTWSGYVSGQSESAVMVELEKKHPGKQIVILQIDWD